MVGTGSTYVELKGKFTFSINQSGLDYRKKKERQQAIEDFEECFNELVSLIGNSEHGDYISLDYNIRKIKVREGE